MRDRSEGLDTVDGATTITSGSHACSSPAVMRQFRGSSRGELERGWKPFESPAQLCDGGSVQNRTIGTATLTYFGWLSIWDTTTVPNGSHALRSVAFDAGNSPASTGRTIKVRN